VLREAGLAFTLEKVDLKTKKTAAGADYWSINSKGAVPALQLDDGRVLTEGPAIVQYIADRAPDSGLAPRFGTFERYQLMETLSYLTSEVHKGFHPLFTPNSSADAKAAAVEDLGKKFDWLSKRLGTSKYLMGDTFTVADAYLFTMLRWTDFVKIDRGKWPALAAYFELIRNRPKVQEAFKAEGIAK
jgi:glutathione S-transferase